MKPRLLDLFCCAGGASRGYELAGFEVYGADIKDQPRYPYPFRQVDVLTLDSAGIRRDFDAIHASPPCQARTNLKHMPNAKEHLDLVPQTRALLKATGLPYIIENVVGAPLQEPVVLCGTMFGLGIRDAELWRHRLFESNIRIAAPGPCAHYKRGAEVVGVYGGHVRNRKRAPVIGVYGHGPDNGKRSRDRGRPDFSLDDAKTAMGIDWMSQAELSQAIPPAYTAHLGAQLMATLRRAA